MALGALDLVLRLPQALAWRVTAGALLFIVSDALIALTAFALCCLSTLYPAWRAARTDPAKALRHE